MKIVVIDNYDSFVYNLIRYVKEITNDEVFVMRNDQINYSVLDSCDALLLSPGPGIPSEAGELMNVISKYFKTKKILGVCLGHQALGQFFGIELIQCKEPVHGKSSVIKHCLNDSLFQQLPPEIEVGRYHSWVLSNVFPEEINISAETIEGEVMAFSHRKYPIVGVQFHPESILTPFGRKMIENWIKS